MNLLNALLLCLFLALTIGSAAVAQVSPDATAENAGNDSLLWLAGITLLAGVGLGVWQWFKVRKAKRNHEHSSLGGVGAADAAKPPRRS